MNSGTTGAPLAWIEVRVLAPESWLELVADALVFGPRDAIAFGRPSLASPEPPAGFEYVRASYPAEEDSPERRAEVQARLERLAEATQEEELAGLSLTFRALPPEDWATSWKKNWKPMRVGRFALVLPEHRGALQPGDIRIELEPGIAFGTGRHPSTRQCLAALTDLPVRGERVLDAGTGSGLLAVAAAKLGASQVHGFDIDPHCVRAARELAERNGVADRCHFETGGFELVAVGAPLAQVPYGALFANIYADLLQQHAPDIARLLRPGGWYALAGCSQPGAAGTRAALANSRLELTRELVRGRWHGFHGHKPG